MLERQANDSCKPFRVGLLAGLSAPVEFPADQLAWIEKALEDNPDVRWTFLFMHEPAWENPSESFKAIQRTIQDRPFTWLQDTSTTTTTTKSMGASTSPWGRQGPPFTTKIRAMWITSRG